jgi:hypothetical protein
VERPGPGPADDRFWDCRFDLGLHGPRWLATDAIKPWQHQSWIFISDPDFALKAGRVLDLYAAA